MRRYASRLLKGLFTADMLGLFLMVTALQLFIFGLSASLRNADLEYFFWASLVGLLASLELGKTNSKPIQASAGMVAAGVVGLWIIGARLAIPLIQLIRAALTILPQIPSALQTRTAPDITPILEVWGVIAQASAALAARFGTWFTSLTSDMHTDDALIRNLIWLLGLWLLAAWMGWFTARREAIRALSPAIVLSAFIVSYSERRVAIIWVLVVILILLMGLWNYRQHIHQWETHRIDFSDSIRYDTLQAVLMLTMLVGAVAFVTPSVSWRTIRDYFRERDKNPVAEALGVQPQPVKPVKAPAPQPVLPRDHLLSGGFANSEELVMTIRTGELPPVPSISIVRNVPRYYWRSVVFDTYVSAGWVTSNAPSQKYNSNTPLIPGLLNDYKPLHLDVRLAESEGRLFWSGTLFSADVPLTVAWRLKPTSSLFADQSALIQADMFTAATNAAAYTAEAYVPIASVEALRRAPSEYPEAIQSRYLQLPRDLPERVRELAREITTGSTNPYDKAKAIEAYLRTNYPYDLEVPAPPPDRDVSEYFLFDLKKGYCDYYATAMAVLVRASGMPARFVSGYAPGEYDASNAQYIVRELHAHSWVEVYFAGIGWIEFEPTASLPEIERIEIPESLSHSSETDSAASRLLLRFHLEQAGYILAPFIAALTMFLLYVTVIEKWRVLRLAPAIAIEHLYRKLYRASRPLLNEQRPLPSETIQEFSERMTRMLLARKEKSRFRSFYAKAQNEIEQLSWLYQTVLFQETHIEKLDARLAWAQWSALRWRLWLARLTMSRVASRAPRNYS